MKTYRIATIPGDGIGKEVVPAGQQLLATLAAASSGLKFEFETFDWGADFYRAHGVMMPDDGLNALRKKDAILFGSAGDPHIPDHITLWGLRLKICQGFDQYANVRPTRILPGIDAPLKRCATKDLDWVIVRENSEGEYAGMGGRAHQGHPIEVATDVTIMTRAGVERILRFAFKLAQSRPRKFLTVITKSNAQRHAMVMWDEIARQIAREFPDVTWDKELVDAATVRMVNRPASLDTIVATNLHADILRTGDALPSEAPPSGAVEGGDLLPKLALGLAQRLGNCDLDDHEEVATINTGSREPAIPQAETLPRLRARRNFQTPFAFQRGHFDLGAQRCPPRLERDFVDQVIAFDRKIGMSRQAHAQKKVAALAPARSRFALAGQTDALALTDAARDFDLVGFDLFGATATQRNLAGGSLERFFQCDHEVGLDVLPAFRRCGATAKTAAERRLAPPSTEERFEEIAKASSTELELYAAVASSGPTETSTCAAVPPIRRRLESARLVPIRPEMVVFRALLGIAQDFVGLVDLLEFLLGRGFFLRLGHIRMMFSRELAESAFDFIGARRFRHAEGLVIVPELNRHRWCG